MYRTKTGRVAGEMSPGGFIFNDRLADGRRSLKVWGWGYGDYVAAKRSLERMGCTVELVQFKTCAWGAGGGRTQFRLHITE